MVSQDIRAQLPDVLFASSDKDKDKDKDNDKDKDKETDDAKDGDGKSTSSTSASTPSTTNSKADDKEERRDKAPNKLDLLLDRLPNCVNRDLIDQAAIEFCYFNTRSNRSRLVRKLLAAPRTELVLVCNEYGVVRLSVSQRVRALTLRILSATVLLPSGCCTGTTHARHWHVGCLGSGRRVLDIDEDPR
jgi:hypothetical protein